MPSHPLLKPGVTHNEVPRMRRLVKAHLVKQGQGTLANSINEVSKVYGENAVKGVKAVQKKHSLVVDGIVGSKTWVVLETVSTSFQLVMVSRDSWGARTPKEVEHVTWTAGTPIRVHHTVNDDISNTLDAEKAAMRAIQNYHMNTKGWNDIAYNYVIFKSGRVYVGRGRNVVGAHTKDHNDDCGIAFYGDYTKTTMTYKQVQAFRAIKSKLGLTGKNIPHSATFNTSCPSKEIINKLGL